MESNGMKELELLLLCCCLPQRLYSPLPSLTLPFVVGHSKLHASVDTLHFAGERGTSSIVSMAMLLWETSGYHWGRGLQMYLW